MSNKYVRLFIVIGLVVIILVLFYIFYTFIKNNSKNEIPNNTEPIVSTTPLSFNDLNGTSDKLEYPTNIEPAKVPSATSIDYLEDESAALYQGVADTKWKRILSSDKGGLANPYSQGEELFLPFLFMNTNEEFSIKLRVSRLSEMTDMDIELAIEKGIFNSLISSDSTLSKLRFKIEIIESSGMSNDKLLQHLKALFLKDPATLVTKDCTILDYSENDVGVITSVDFVTLGNLEADLMLMVITSDLADGIVYISEATK